MPDELCAALEYERFAMSGLLFGLDRTLDADGRPIQERRAPSEVRKDVPMEMRVCPYPDARRGMWMNVSALRQVVRHAGAVERDIQAFHRLRAEPEPSWWGMWLAVVDQLAAPARHVLDKRDRTARVPVIASVGHKLAAGYFGALVRLQTQLARGADVPPDLDAFLAFLDTERSLVGASEACAGPRKMIRRFTDVFLSGAHEPSGSPEPAAPVRLVVARALCQQVGLGIAWRQLDACVERWLLIEPGVVSRLAPRTRTIERALRTRVDELRCVVERPAVEHALRALPPGLDRVTVAALRSAVLCEGEPWGDVEHSLRTILDEHAGAFVWDEPGDAAAIARCMAQHLHAHRVFVAALYRQELEIRSAIGYPSEVPMSLGPLIHPLSGAMRWLEAATGRRLSCRPSASPALVLASARRSTALPQ